MPLNSTKLHSVMSCLFALLLSACGSTSTAPMVTPLTENVRVYSQPGETTYRVEPGRLSSSTGCNLAYETYQPDQRNTDAAVMLAHGLYRDKSSMRGWASLWASFGIPVTIFSFCEASLFNPKIERNAEDMQFLATSLHSGPILYAGYSAGGLAAWLAAGSASNTLAYLGLESVDSDSLASTQVSIAEYPSLLLVAEPAFCNAYNNMVDGFSLKQSASNPAAVFQIKGSTHCNFSHPFGRPCSSVCGRVNPADAELAILESIRTLATAWVLNHTLNDELAESLLADAMADQRVWRQRLQVLN